MNIDTNLFFFLNNFAGQNTLQDKIIIFFAEYLAYILVIVFLVYLFYSAYSYREKIVAGLTALIAGLLSRYAIGSTIRFLWHRPRPFVTLHVHQLITESSYSFPSGHSTFFFAFATIVYCYSKKLGIFFYIATICLTIARVMAGVHYPSDIAAGMVIGIICGWFTFKYITPHLEKLLNVELKLKKI